MPGVQATGITPISIGRGEIIRALIAADVPAAAELERLEPGVGQAVGAELGQRPLLGAVEAVRIGQPVADAVHQLMGGQHRLASVHALVDDPRVVARLGERPAGRRKRRRGQQQTVA